MLLETDCAKLKEKIRATEAKIKDLAVKAPGSVMKSKPATGKTDSEECDVTGLCLCRQKNNTQLIRIECFQSPIRNHNKIILKI